MAVIELEVLSGKGGWEGTKGNLTGYTYREASTPLAADDSSGATPAFTVGVSEDEDINGTFALLESTVRLTDEGTGAANGIVRTISSSDGAAGLEIESVLSVMNANIIVPPYTGNLSGAITYYMNIAGIAPNNYTVDSTIATRPVTFPGWAGPMWDNLKQLCVAEQVELAGVNGRVVVRPIRTVTGNEQRNISVSFTVDNTTVAKNIEIYYYNNTYKPVGRMYPTGVAVQNLPDTANQVSAQSFQVGAGEVSVTSVAINAYIMEIYQPIPATSVSQELTDSSEYVVIDRDGKIVDPGLWLGTGGKVTAAIGSSPSEMVITVTGAALDARAPFRLAMPIPTKSTEQSDTFPSLRISGKGVFFTKQMFRIPTGADPKLAIADVGITIDNPFISTIQQASRAGVLAARNYSGRNKTVQISATGVADIGINGAIVYYPYDTFENDQTGKSYNQFQTSWAGKSYNDFATFARAKSADAKLVQAFGNVVGARIPYRNSMYRVRDITYTENGLQYTAESDTIVTDFTSVHTGVSYAQFAAKMAGRTYNDHALAPLYKGA